MTAEEQREAIEVYEAAKHALLDAWGRAEKAEAEGEDDPPVQQ